MNRDDIKHLVPTEHEIQTLIKNYLTAKGWYVLRLNSGRIPMSDYRGKQRMIWMGETGTPDLMAFKKKGTVIRNDDGSNGIHTYLSLLFIEVKRPGKKPTFNQVQKMKELEEKGAKCIVASSLEDLQAEGL